VQYLFVVISYGSSIDNVTYIRGRRSRIYDDRKSVMLMKCLVLRFGVKNCETSFMDAPTNFYQCEKGLVSNLISFYQLWSMEFNPRLRILRIGLISENCDSFGIV